MLPYTCTLHGKKHKKESRKGVETAKKIPPKLLRQLENKHEDFIKRGPCGEVIRLDGSQSRDTVLQKATLALLEVGERHNSNLWALESHQLWANNTVPSIDHGERNRGALELLRPRTNNIGPLIGQVERKRNPNGGHHRTTTVNPKHKPLPERHSVSNEVWISFLGRPYQKIMIPWKTLNGSEIRKHIAHALGVPHSLLRVYHENRLVISQKELSLPQGAFLRIELGLAGGSMKSSDPIQSVKYKSTDGKTVSHQWRETKELGRNHEEHGSFVRKNLTKLRMDPTQTPYGIPQKKKRIWTR